MKRRKAPAARAIEPDREFRARDAMHTLLRAEEIKRDPKLMADVKRHADEHRKALGKIARTRI